MRNYMTLLKILETCDEALHRPQEEATRNAFLHVQQICTGILKAEGFPVTHLPGNDLIETDGKTYNIPTEAYGMYETSAPVFENKKAEEPVKDLHEDVEEYVEYADKREVQAEKAEKNTEVLTKESEKSTETLMESEFTESIEGFEEFEEPEINEAPKKEEVPVEEMEEPDDDIWANVPTNEPEEKRKQLEDDPDEYEVTAGEPDMQAEVMEEPEESEEAMEEPDIFTMDLDDETEAFMKKVQNPKKSAKTDAVEKAEKAETSEVPEKQKREEGPPAKKKAPASSRVVAVSHVKPRSRMRYQDFMYAKCKLRLMKDNKPLEKLTALVFPIDIDKDDTEFVMAVGKNARIYALTSENGLISTSIYEGIRVNIRGFMRDGDFEVRISLPRDFEDEGYTLERIIEGNGKLGHIIQEDEWTRIHVFPISPKNDQFGNANFIYYLESKDLVQTGITDKDSEVIFQSDGQKYRLKCVWDEETHVLDSSIIPV